MTNFNGASLTRGAVESLATSPHWTQCEIVIVDNHSDTQDVDQLEQLKQEYPRIHVVWNDVNAGYFPGLNVGISYIRARFPELNTIVVGNNDLVFPSDFVDSIRENAGLLAQHWVISPDLITLDGVHQNPHVINGISKPRKLIYDIYYSWYPFALFIRWFARHTRRFTRRTDSDAHRIGRPIHTGYGACYILGPQFFRHFTELWAPTFLMGEELFLSKQLRDHGQQVYYEPSIKVRHHDHASVDKIPTRQMWLVSREAHKICKRYEK